MQQAGRGQRVRQHSAAHKAVMLRSPNRTRKGIANSRLVNGLALATTLAAWCVLYWIFHPHPPPFDRRPHEGLGQVLADEALKLLAPGGRLIVLARDPQSSDVPASAVQLQSFLRQLRKSGQAVAALRGLKQDPLRLAGVPSGEFYDVIRKAREHDVLVSFLGPPVLERDQLAALGNKRPRVVAVCSGALPSYVNLKMLFEQHLLSAAVVSRGLPQAGAHTGSRQAAFEHMFQLITPANLADLPEVAAMHP